MNKVKNYIIKIPNNIKILYQKQNNLLVIEGKLGKRILEFKTKLIINKIFKTIEITNIVSFSKANNEKKRIKAYRKTSLALLKQSFLEVSIILFKKLKLVGIGYKVIFEKIINQKFLVFKLGYSHNIYFKIPNYIKIICIKSDTILILGQSYANITQLASVIKSFKLPEPYKGKGILYDNEKIILKEGKKI
uniref:Ribosomal protein L6 n=1 Tax=Lithodesmium undulatum TaxID=59812 RepID=A0A7T7A9R6_LITUN|nr:ribosomal protein L6 [Lithodesmium undulatum]QQJ94645.1 ribosomal protein L6 [Lithodesmium undulatum]